MEGKKMGNSGRFIERLYGVLMAIFAICAAGLLTVGTVNWIMQDQFPGWASGFGGLFAFAAIVMHVLWSGEVSHRIRAKYYDHGRPQPVLVKRGMFSPEDK